MFSESLEFIGNDAMSLQKKFQKKRIYFRNSLNKTKETPLHVLYKIH